MMMAPFSPAAAVGGFPMNVPWPFGRTLLTFLLSSGLLAAPSVGAQPPEQSRSDHATALGYIVVFHDDVDVDDTIKTMKQRHGFSTDMAYRHALKGMAGFVPPGRLRALERDPRVRFIEPVQPMFLHAQTLPTGVRRINGLLDPLAAIDNIDTRVDVDIAIIDTGIDLDHPDLNVFRFVYCYRKNPQLGQCDENDIRANDTHGHGTHVAGTAAALDNNIGVVGVAPGARLWGIRVMQDDGSISSREVIAAVDYVATHASEIEVANMSLGIVGGSAAVDAAISGVAAAGVTMVVSAGNDSIDVANTSPGGNPDAITVSALADFDGLPGGLLNQGYSYTNCTESEDDSFACFSNFGSGIDIMAPGTAILSTWNNGGTATLHGTSMASPHVAGAAALYLAQNAGASPATVKAALLANGDSAPCDTVTGACLDDPDGVAEPLLLAQPHPDTDNDGVIDFFDNCPLNSNPDQQDLDTDGIGDVCDICPTVANDDIADPDLDGLGNFAECVAGTDPALWDTDGDGLRDGDEVDLWFTDPLEVDTDLDGFDDYLETQLGTGPNLATEFPATSNGDVNGDGLLDARDILLAQQALLGGVVLDLGQGLRCDVAPLIDGSPSPDGALTAGDLVLIQRLVFGDLVL